MSSDRQVIHKHSVPLTFTIPSLSSSMEFHWSNAPPTFSWPSHASHVAESVQGLTIASRDTVLNSNELLSRIVRNVAWRDLGRVGRVSVRFRVLAQDTARSRIRETWGPIADGLGLDVDWVLKALRDRGGGVIGAAAMKVLTWGEVWDNGYSPVRRMTLAIPYDELDKLVEELAKKGLREWKYVDVYGPAKHMIRRVIEFSAGKDENITFLRIVESAGGVMQAVVCSDTTEDMVVITASRIYLLYPQLVHRFLAVKGRWTRVRLDISRKGPTLERSNMNWAFDCGKICPASWRKGDEGSGIGVFYWNGDREREVFGKWWKRVEEPGDQLSTEETWSGSDFTYGWRGYRALSELDEDTLLGRDVFKWSLSNSCENPGCVRHPRMAFARDVGVQVNIE